MDDTKREDVEPQEPDTVEGPEDDARIEAPTEEAAEDDAELDVEEDVPEKDEVEDTVQAEAKDEDEEPTDADEEPAPAEPMGQDAPQAAPAPSPVVKHMKTVTTAAKKASTSLTQQTSEGFTALRAVGKAKREHAHAKEQLAQLQAQIDADSADLAKRRGLLDRYDEIVAAQTEARDKALQTMHQLLDEADAQNDKAGRYQKKLEALKKDDAKALRPYKQALDKAKSASGDADKRLSDAKKALRSAESALKDLVKRRDDRVSQANRAIDASQRRIAQLQEDLASAQRNPDASSGDVARLRSDHAAEMGRLSKAREEVDAAPTELAGPIADAKERVSDATSARDDAQREADSAKQAWKQAKREHDEEAAAFQKHEDAVEDKVIEAQKECRRLKNEAAQHQQAADDAQTALDEAEEVHAHPEKIRDLENSVADNRAAAELQSQQVDALAQAEKDVRKKTLSSRVVFVLVVAAAVIILVLVFLMLNGQ